MATKHKDFYKDLDTMPIYNFMKCIDRELKYMYVSKNGEITNKIVNKWEKLYNKFCELTKNNEMFRYYRLIGEIEYLDKRIEIAPVLVSFLSKNIDKQSICDELGEWGLKLNLKKPLKPQLDRIAKTLNNSKNKLNRKKEELEKINNKPKEDISLQAQKAKLHRILGISVNIFTTSVTEWLAYWDEVKQLSKVNNG